MSLYSVYAHESDGPVAVADRFSWSAALVPPVHALVHGLWLLFVGWLVGTATIVALSFVIGGEAGFWLYMLMAILIGFEAPAFRRVKTAKAWGDYQGDYIARGEDFALVEYLKRQGK